MDRHDLLPAPLNDRLNLWWERGVRIATRLAIAFGLAALTAMVLGAAVTDNGFVQIVVTLFAALGLWLPFAILIAAVQRAFERRRSVKAERAQASGVRKDGSAERSWRRLLAAAPAQAERILAIRRSIERSHGTLRTAELDPQAHELCVLIDRRLPDLINRELDNLAPDDVHRGRQLDELVNLVEQFARHCSRSGTDHAEAAAFDSAVLRRRFEAHLSQF